MLTSLSPAAFMLAGSTDLSDSKGMLMAVITCSGILIVFVVLLLLIIIFYAYGGIFKAVTSSKEKKLAAKKDSESHAEERHAAPAVSSSSAPAPVDDGTIPGEIIAVIAAAVAALGDGKKYAVKKVSRAQRQTGRRSSWAASGIYENTRPF